jgi:hypothetical protein
MSSGADEATIGEHRFSLVMARLKPRFVPPEQVALRAGLGARARRRGVLLRRPGDGGPGAVFRSQNLQRLLDG